MSLERMLADEEYLIGVMSMIMITNGLIIYFSRMRGQYGRYSSSSTVTILVPARWAWFFQECPTILVPLGLIIWGKCKHLNNLDNAFAVGLFLFHYLQRTLLFPILIRGGKPTPLNTFLAAIIFCTCNGYMQGRFHCHIVTYADGHRFSPLALLGIAVFFIGFVINIHSDHILRCLRKPGETGYRIPRGGLFEYVSGANYLGEIVEWIGYAMYAQTLPAFAFALFTASNLGPRAWQHHEYYLEKFRNYPKSRKALIPFLI